MAERPHKTDLVIPAPDFETVAFRIRGTSPYAQNAWSAKAKAMIHETQAAGSTAKKGKAKEAKNFQEAYKEAMHVSPESWYGIPAAAFRKAMVTACKIVGFQMSRAKLGLVGVQADGFDAGDGTPLVRITKGEPEYWEAPVRVGMGTTDLRARPLWRAGWEAVVRVTYDAGMFTAVDVANLMLRAGLQVGVGEGRNDTPSCGIGFGSFTIVENEDKSNDAK